MTFRFVNADDLNRQLSTAVQAQTIRMHAAGQELHHHTTITVRIPQ
jgi:hypothetical protein